MRAVTRFGHPQGTWVHPECIPEERQWRKRNGVIPILFASWPVPVWLADGTHRSRVPTGPNPTPAFTAHGGSQRDQSGPGCKLQQGLTLLSSRNLGKSCVSCSLKKRRRGRRNNGFWSLGHPEPRGHWVPVQVHVGTEPAGRVVVKPWVPERTAIGREDLPGFRTMRTLRPPRGWNGALGTLLLAVDAIRTEPGRTSREAWAMTVRGPRSCRRRGGKWRLGRRPWPAGPPGRSRARRRHDLQAGLDPEDFLQDGQEVGWIRIQAEAPHLWIGGPPGQVVASEDAFVEARGSDGDPEKADADVGSIGGEEFARELGASRRGHPAQRLGAATGERES